MKRIEEMDEMERDDGRVRVDLHAHTWYSPDSVMRPETLVERAAAMGIGRIAVTDHGEIEGALRAWEADPARVIVGEEIRARCGTELIGLFLRERIPYGLALEETAERIRAQGGVVYAPHPYAYGTRGAWRAARSLPLADVAEVFNSRAFLPLWNRAAAAEVARRALPAAAGSDSHFPWEIGRAYTLLPSFATAPELRAALAHAQPVGVRAGSPLLHVASLSLHGARVAVSALTSGALRFPRREVVAG
ncbi:MAG TPA: PHP-associated domain-containing protein [Longimicrobium sp.]|nr:PHP-associated domain-containing protein [Longimicrobium sp.]